MKLHISAKNRGFCLFHWCEERISSWPVWMEGIIIKMGSYVQGNRAVYAPVVHGSCGPADMKAHSSLKGTKVVPNCGARQTYVNTSASDLLINSFEINFLSQIWLLCPTAYSAFTILANISVLYKELSLKAW